ncbi:MAG: hypothetical protein H0U70_08920 [Tatlockia sp.]|nr:hypothetical protein [Tatlockia sp.]
MNNSFSTLKNKMSFTAQKAVEEKTILLLKEVLLFTSPLNTTITMKSRAKA